MIDWGKKKYPGQAQNVQIGPRTKSGGSAPKPVMSKAGTPMKASAPAPKKTPGWTYGPHGNAPKPKPKPATKPTSKLSKSRVR